VDRAFVRQCFPTPDAYVVFVQDHIAPHTAQQLQPYLLDGDDHLPESCGGVLAWRMGTSGEGVCVARPVLKLSGRLTSGKVDICSSPWYDFNRRHEVGAKSRIVKIASGRPEGLVPVCGGLFLSLEVQRV
jgi:hypothetical protein